MSRSGSQRPLALVLLTLVGALACEGGGGGLGSGSRIAELESRIDQLEQRLAELPAETGLDAATVGELLHRLASRDAVKRYRAVRELGRRGESVHGELFRQLSGLDEISMGFSEPEDLRRRREGAAAVLASSDAKPKLRRLLEFHEAEREPKVRAFLVAALGRSGERKAVAPLSEDLYHDSLSVRIAAVRGLGELGALEGFAPLLSIALGAEPQLAPLARGSLEGLEGDPFLAVDEVWPQLNGRQRQDALTLLSEMDVDGVELFLLEQLRDPSPLVALTAAGLLAQRGDEGGLALAQQRLGSDDPVVARKAREVLDELER